MPTAPELPRERDHAITITPQEGRRWFFIGCAMELGLLALGVLIARLTGRSIMAETRWDGFDAFAGVAACLPLFAGFVWMLRSPAPLWAGIRRILDSALRPIFRHWSIAQLALISALAGACEEALFRGALQGALQGWLGPAPALVTASVVFGLAHPLSRAYVVLTALMGLVLGGLWLATGNLLAPILTHAVYDFLALVWFLRVHRPE